MNLSFGQTRTSQNPRGNAAKLFKRFILSNVEHRLITSCNQFGFKSGPSTQYMFVCFLLKQIAGHRNECGSPVYTLIQCTYTPLKHLTRFVILLYL